MGGKRSFAGRTKIKNRSPGTIAILTLCRTVPSCINLVIGAKEPSFLRNRSSPAFCPPIPTFSSDHCKDEPAETGKRGCKQEKTRWLRYRRYRRYRRYVK